MRPVRGSGSRLGDGWDRAHPELPVFRLSLGRKTLVYVPPGRFTLLDPAGAERLFRAWEGGEPLGQRSLTSAKRWCEEAGREAKAQWRALAREPFAPECLTVSLGSDCSCRCQYCFVKPQAQSTAFSWEAAAAAASLVAASCRAKAKPFFLVVHGGGEPTLHWDLLTRIHSLGIETAARFGLEFRGYIATNGLVELDQARWLAESFGRVGLSCDGPPALHDGQRPRADGSPTSGAVARTAAAIRNAGGHLTVRATITPASLVHQEAIAEHLCREIGADDLAFEPWFGVGGQPGVFAAGDAETFAARFVAAQRVAASFGRELSFAGVRIEELHGPFCDSARHTLRLLPDGRALDCFAAAGQAGPAQQAYEVGHFDAAVGAYSLAESRIAELRQRAFSLPEGCHGCVNLLHCSRGCPEACVGAGQAGEFRCRLHRALTRHWLAEAARQAGEPERERIAADTAARRPALESRSLPLPPWERYGYSLTGREVWKQIAEERPDPGAPISIYVHIPFCDRRCGFCDCLSRPKRGQDEAAFVRALLREIAAWGRLAWVGKAPVTTVHFGGGTPACLAPGAFTGIVKAIAETFGLGLGGMTELALETTVGRASPADLAFLRSLGFTRLHLGIQTFDDRLRRSIGRRHGGRAAGVALRNAVEAGWTASVDLLFGLPGQSRADVLRSIEEAVAAGAHGVSLYRFNTSPRNTAFAGRVGGMTADARADFETFLAAEERLTRAGYAKSHFTHYALPKDRNLYYRHAARGEALVALGPTADGAVGDWLFRHTDLDAYLGADIEETLGLEGGLTLPEQHRAAGPLSASLFCGKAERVRYEERGLGALLAAWVEEGWLRPAEGGTYLLTAAGSWFLDRMLGELLP